jgi:hypothetical protein
MRIYTWLDIIVGGSTSKTEMARVECDSSSKSYPERKHGPCFIVGGIADPMRQR